MNQYKIITKRKFSVSGGQKHLIQLFKINYQFLRLLSPQYFISNSIITFDMLGGDLGTIHFDYDL